MWQQTVSDAMNETFPSDTMSYRLGHITLSFSSFDEQILVFIQFDHRNLARRVGVSLPDQWILDNGHRRVGDGKFNLRSMRKSYTARIIDEYNPINVSSTYDVGFLIAEDEIAAVIRQIGEHA